MATILPRVFIGSSSEAREIAQAFCTVLAPYSKPVPWWISGAFTPMVNTFESLRNASEDYDFGLFLLTPDDDVTSRGDTLKSARDNVLFELGLFLGILGQDRVFGVVEASDAPEKKVKVLSDLNGLSMAQFTNRDELDRVSSVNNAAQEIIKQIGVKQRRQRLFDLKKKFDYNEETRTFHLTLAATKIAPRKDKLRDRPLFIVVRKHDPSQNFEDDPRIVVSTPRTISPYSDDDLALSAHGPDLPTRLDPGERMECHLLIGPKGFKADGHGTIMDMIQSGCTLLDSVAYGMRPH